MWTGYSPEVIETLKKRAEESRHEFLKERLDVQKLKDEMKAISKDISAFFEQIDNQPLVNEEEKQPKNELYKARYSLDVIEMMKQRAEDSRQEFLKEAEEVQTLKEEMRSISNHIGSLFEEMEKSESWTQSAVKPKGHCQEQV